MDKELKGVILLILTCAIAVGIVAAVAIFAR